MLFPSPSSIVIIAAITLAFIIGPAAAAAADTGADCDGSRMCGLVTILGFERLNILQRLTDAVWESPIDNSTVYDKGAHIACFREELEMLGEILPTPVYPVFGGICLFTQNTALTMGQIRQLTIKALVRGCKICANVPFNYVNEGSEQLNPGLLTYDYVHHAECKDYCILANDGEDEGGDGDDEDDYGEEDEEDDNEDEYNKDENNEDEYNEDDSSEDGSSYDDSGDDDSGEDGISEDGVSGDSVSGDGNSEGGNGEDSNSESSKNEEDPPAL